ncbi:uncharacterized protein LOC142226680 [Haematobia irritans]|uniref:Putative alcohol dehydrogenase transcription factor myb/sant-like protein n=1 Tax=Haematobia irritans TaxID=7368 RepID=A0A1L8EJ34_HAEIR
MKYNDKKLIALLKVNNVLYNKHHPLANTKNKKIVWNKIADEMGLPVDRVIARYRTLRDRFVRYKRSLLTKGPDNNYDMAIMGRMEFLTPYIFIRTNGGKIVWEGSEPSLYPSGDPLHTMGETEDENSTKHNSQPQKRTINVSTSEDSNDTYGLEAKRNNTNVGPSYSNDDSSQCQTIDYEYDNGNKNTAMDEEFADAVRCFIQLCESEGRAKGNRALQGFGQMIIATLAEMNIRKQSKAIALVTEAVMEIKMEDNNQQ